MLYHGVTWDSICFNITHVNFNHTTTLSQPTVSIAELLFPIVTTFLSILPALSIVHA